MFLEDILDATAEIETPRSFIFWAGLSAISAVKGRDVYLDKYYYKLYPNIYVLLVARSGLRKTFAVNSLAKPLVERIGNTRVIGGRNSIQGILRELSTARTSSNGQAPIVDARAFINSGEFSNLVINDPTSLTILTDLYDSHYNPEWENTLKESRDKLKNIYITMLGATNQTHFKDRIGSIDIEGGFIARTLIIMEEKKALVNALVDEPKIKFDVDKLVEPLREIAKISGPFVYSPAGKKFFKEWYEDYCKQIREDKTGSAERFNDTVLKVSMLLALNHGTLILDVTEIDSALKLCEQYTVKVETLTAGIGKNEFGPKIALVLSELLSAEGNTISKGVLLRKHYGTFDTKDLERIIQTLFDMGAVTLSNRNGDTYYTLLEKYVEDYKRLKRA